VRCDMRMSEDMLSSSPWHLFVPGNSSSYVEWWHPVEWLPRMRTLTHRRLMAGEFMNMHLKRANGEVVRAIGTWGQMHDRYVDGHAVIERCGEPGCIC